MTEAEIKEILFKLLRKIAPEANPESLAPEENIRRALDIDSFDALNFFIALHEELGVEIPEADYGQLNSIADMVRYLAVRSG
ncbi:MAG: phosphopantetheine-binding protein [Desulforhabdus sp.]|jgi:acyl carrier protein|nr:phosphopantetheine-binding protein [Desulforhabdus sp.]